MGQRLPPASHTGLAWRAWSGAGNAAHQSTGIHAHAHQHPHAALPARPSPAQPRPKGPAPEQCLSHHLVQRSIRVGADLRRRRPPQHMHQAGPGQACQACCAPLHARERLSNGTGKGVQPSSAEVALRKTHLLWNHVRIQAVHHLHENCNQSKVTSERVWFSWAVTGRPDQGRTPRCPAAPRAPPHSAHSRPQHAPACTAPPR